VNADSSRCANRHEAYHLGKGFSGSELNGTPRTVGLIMDNVTPVSHAERPVFQQPWWLAIAVSSGPYWELKLVEDGIEQGNLLYTTGRNKIGLRWGYSPFWSHLGGPLVDSALSEDRKRQVLEGLIAQLPRNIYFPFCLQSPRSGCCPGQGSLCSGRIFAYDPENLFLPHRRSRRARPAE
jgi:hypothetical protein